ncbi:MAG: hypothetical protein H7248_09545, partial [Microbacteriaceae bacterium]|nr:hypothetical protein [Microbacteriaceae bacterium]
AAQVFVTMLLVIYNLRHIAAFQNELNIPSKTYTPQTSVFYVPYIDKRKMMRGEKMAAALAMLKPVTPDPPERS